LKALIKDGLDPTFQTAETIMSRYKSMEESAGEYKLTGKEIKVMLRKMFDHVTNNNKYDIVGIDVKK
jgi:hypothetical protein